MPLNPRLGEVFAKANAKKISFRQTFSKRDAKEFVSSNPASNPSSLIIRASFFKEASVVRLERTKEPRIYSFPRKTSLTHDVPASHISAEGLFRLRQVKAGMDITASPIQLGDLTRSFM